MNDRLLYNRAIVNKLVELVKKYPDWRFGQLLANVDVTRYIHPYGNEDVTRPCDIYCDKSKDIWERMCKINGVFVMNLFRTFEGGYINGDFIEHIEKSDNKYFVNMISGELFEVDENTYNIILSYGNANVN